MYKYNKIRDLREDNDYTQEYVSKYLETGLTTYRRWEIGEREIPVHKLIKLAELYNVSLDYLVGNQNNEKTRWKIKNQIIINNEGKNKIEMK